jgi:adenosylmethionine-8-amino-7-oxononanoate aminotransferase
MNEHRSLSVLTTHLPSTQQRLREICDKHGLLLIFDEVITGFGRLGKGFAAEYFDVVPDMITTAKGLTNGTVPAGERRKQSSE